MIPGERSASERATETTFTREIIELEPDESDVDIKGDTSESETSDVEKDKARKESLEKLQSSHSPSQSRDTGKHVALEVDMKARDKPRGRVKAKGPDAVIVLKEEKVDESS